jgi:hypothetical protein
MNIEEINFEQRTGSIWLTVGVLWEHDAYPSAPNKGVDVLD